MIVLIFHPPPPKRSLRSRGGGGHSTFMWTGGGGGGAAGGRKPDRVVMRSVHKKYTLSQYTRTKNLHMHTLSQYCTVAGAQIAGLS